LLRQQRLFSDLVSQNVELFDLKLRLQERTAEVELMFDVERAAAVARDLDEALDGALRRTLTELPCEVATVILVERGDARTSFAVRRSAGPGAHKLAPQVLGLDRLVVETAVHGRTVTRSEWDRGAHDVDAFFSTLLGRLDAKEFAAIPIARPGEAPLGALLLVNPTIVPRGFDEHHLHKLSVIASRIALSVVLATIMEEERKAERLAAIGGALSSVVHDLRTPLTLLSGYARLLEREDAPDKRQALRELHKRQVEQLQVMIKEILAFAKGQQDLFLRKVWVRDLLADLEELLRAEPTETNGDATVTLVIDPAYKGAVKADEAKLKRALLNLAKNAREAMGQSGGTLTISAAESAGRIVFSVSDTGPGIPAEMEGRLFQSFATHGKDSGTGLGLAIVKTIVEQHEGTLDVSSGPTGTTFTLSLSPA
jgi:signal transduction histidine kinase